MTPSILESTARTAGFKRVCGIDEAGRGALAGPLVIAAVILPEGRVPEGVADSKALRDDQRVRILRELRALRAHISVATIPPVEVDRSGVHVCNLRGFREAVAMLPSPPEYVLCDGFPPSGVPYPSLGVKKGDAVEACIAAASIVAKVARDEQMKQLDAVYPGYGFAQHKGYGTLSHRRAIEQHGLSPVHRRSFCTNIALPVDSPARA